MNPQNLDQNVMPVGGNAGTEAGAPAGVDGSGSNHQIPRADAPGPEGADGTSVLPAAQSGVEHSTSIGDRVAEAYVRLGDPSAELTTEDREVLTQATVRGLHDHVNPALAKWRKSGDARACEWRGQGWLLYDLAGNEYIDCLGGYGVFNFGHLHPRIVDAVQRGLTRMGIHSQELLNPWQARFATKFAELAPGDLQYVFFSNSGTESVEAAIKFAMMRTGRHEIIGTVNGYHGKTLGSLSATFREVFRAPFEPLLSFRSVPYNDASELEAAIGPQTAAFIMEPVQGEAGIIVPDRDYLPRVRELCTKHGVLLILDEVQTCMGRTGKHFACEHWGVVPDLMCVAKSIGGGIIPMGVTIGTARVWEALEPNPFIHSNTFGGNPLACVAGLAAMEVLVEERLAEQSATTGQHFADGLMALKSEFPQLIREVRGLGLMIGIEFMDRDNGVKAAKELFNAKVLVAHTLNNPKVMRIEPPLMIPVEAVDEVLQRFRSVLEKMG
ncbi:MAG TPA: aminotransferase class III-fold pyridoxal phosphate-dependent enzyme [bacterium]|nr:aminotransferase class III-fold pyridoxal phosphate-dependent enzyme [bacterium]